MIQGASPKEVPMKRFVVWVVLFWVAFGLLSKPVAAQGRPLPACRDRRSYETSPYYAKECINAMMLYGGGSLSCGDLSVPPEQVLLSDPICEERILMAHYLAQVESKRSGNHSATLLLEAYQRETNPRVRGHIFHAMRLLSDASFLPFFHQALDSTNYVTVINALYGIGQVRDPSSVLLITRKLEQEMAKKVRRVVVGGWDACVYIETLGEIGSDSALPFFRRYVDYAGYSHCVSEALGKIGDPAGIPLVLRSLLNDTSNELTHQHESKLWLSIEALGKLRVVWAAPLIEPLLKERDGWIYRTRFAAAETLGKLAQRSSIPALEEAALGDPDEEVRKACVRALSQIKGP